MQGELEKETSPTVGGDDGRERYQSVLCHFLFLIISHNVGVINPRKCGFISPSLGVKMKCELIDQVYTVAEIIKAQCGEVSRDIRSDRNNSKSFTTKMMFKGEVTTGDVKTPCTIKWSDHEEQLVFCMISTSLILCSEHQHKALVPASFLSALICITKKEAFSQEKSRSSLSL